MLTLVTIANRPKSPYSILWGVDVVKFKTYSPNMFKNKLLSSVCLTLTVIIIFLFNVSTKHLSENLSGATLY